MKSISIPALLLMILAGLGETTTAGTLTFDEATAQNVGSFLHINGGANVGGVTLSFFQNVDTYGGTSNPVATYGVAAPVNFTRGSGNVLQADGNGILTLGFQPTLNVSFDLFTDGAYSESGGVKFHYSGDIKQTIPVSASAGNQFSFSYSGTELVNNVAIRVYNKTSDFYIDNFVYGDNGPAVPEPSSALLWAVGGTALLLGMRRRNRSLS